MTQPYYQPQQETIYYQDPSPVFISSARVVILNHNFVIKNVGSVSIVVKPPSSTFAMILIVVGVLLCIVGLSNFISPNPNAIALLLWGAGMAITGIFIIKGSRTNYLLIIGSAGSQISVLSSHDRTYISKIADAINTVIITNH